MKVITLIKRGGRKSDPRPLVTISRTCRLNEVASLVTDHYSAVDLAEEDDSLFLLINDGSRKLNKSRRYVTFSGSGVNPEFHGKYQLVPDGDRKNVYRLDKV